MRTNKARESRLRRHLAHDGYVLRKSRKRTWSLEDRGEYMVVDPISGAPVVGWHYDATLDDVEQWMQA